MRFKLSNLTEMWICITVMFPIKFSRHLFIVCHNAGAQLSCHLVVQVVNVSSSALFTSSPSSWSESRFSSSFSFLFDGCGPADADAVDCVSAVVAGAAMNLFVLYLFHMMSVT
jgi:hypothetical protein